MVKNGAYAKGSSQEIDMALQRIGPIQDYLRQHVDERQNLDDSFAGLFSLLDKGVGK